MRAFGEKRCLVCGAYGKELYCPMCAEVLAKSVLKAILRDPGKYGVLITQITDVFPLAEIKINPEKLLEEI